MNTTTKKDLIEKAKELNIKGIYKINKEDLYNTINNYNKSIKSPSKSIKSPTKSIKSPTKSKYPNIQMFISSTTQTYKGELPKNISNYNILVQLETIISDFRSLLHYLKSKHNGYIDEIKDYIIIFENEYVKIHNNTYSQKISSFPYKSDWVVWNNDEEELHYEMEKLLVRINSIKIKNSKEIYKFIKNLYNNYVF